MFFLVIKMSASTNRDSEKISIKLSGNGLRRYGSTCNHIKRVESYVIHYVQKTDTLQGLALKYNTTTEQIRRINRLFASDSIFLRDTLKIPVVKENGDSSSIPPSTSDSAIGSSCNRELASFDDCDDDATAMNTLFGKIDSSIAETKAQVNISQQQSQFLHNPEDVIWKQNKKNGRGSSINENTLESNTQPVVFSHGRKVRTSLQRLEQEQDDLFEL